MYLDMVGEYTLLGKISDDTDRWAIDGTILKHNGTMYFVWSGWEGDINVCQNLYIAEMDGPLKISSKRFMISTPEYDWEKAGARGEIESPFINEGPFAAYNNDETYILYSAAGSWCEDYCIAALKLIGDNPLDINSWKKSEKPIISKNEMLKGAGHCSAIKEKDMYRVFFHAWENSETEISWNRVSVWQGELSFDGDNITIK